MKSTSQPSKCPECAYVRSERAAIHEFDGKASREWAEYMAGFERCIEHTLAVLPESSQQSSAERSTDVK